MKLTNPSRSHSVGKIMTMPKRIKMLPESVVQKDWGTCMKMELTFNRNVNRITETPSEIAIVYALLRSPSCPCAIEPPTMTGKSGSTQGASAVSTPATKEMKSKIIN